jgi:hypothetical protein
MCDCISKIEEKATAQLQEQPKFKKPVTKVRMQGVVFPLIGNTLTTRTCNMLEIELEGQKKRPEMTISHSYCPFCGEKYGTA